MYPKGDISKDSAATAAESTPTNVKTDYLQQNLIWV